MKLKRLFLCSAILTGAIANAQIPYINSKEILELGIKFHDDKEYKKAIEYYKMIPDGDTNYIQAVYEESLSYLQDSAFRESIATARYGLGLPRNPIKRPFLLNIASAYDYLGLTDSAMMIYDSVAKLYPLDNQPYYEKGILHFRKKDYDAATHYFQRSLVMNPFHFNSSYMLGLVYALQGRLAEAIIVSEGAMWHTTDADRAKKAINVVSEIARISDDIDQAYKKKAKKYKHPLFDEIDEIVAAKLVFSKEYELKTTVDDKITRQTQAILEKLVYNEKDTNFVMQYYVPLLESVYKEDLFDAYVLNLFSGYGIEEVENRLKKNKSATGEISKRITDHIYRIYSTNTLNYKQRQAATPRYFYYDGNTIVDGKLKDKANMIFDEGPVKVYEHHLLTIAGQYDKNGKKTGKWTRYYNNGGLKDETNYKDGIAVGELKEYAGSGALRKLSQYGEDGKLKEEKSYTKEGILDAVEKHQPNGDIEYTSYYPNGNKEVRLVVRKEQVADGPYTYYYDNGAVKREANWKGGKPHGKFKEYYESGKVNIEGTLEDNEREGPYTTYYENGKVDNIYTYHKGVLEGPYGEYSEAGTLVDTGAYKKGKLYGPQTYFTFEGRQYSDNRFENNMPTAIKYTGKDGKTVYEKQDKNGLQRYEHYYSNGNKRSEITLNKNAEADGSQTYYYYTGSKWQTTTYKAGKLEGANTTFYKNGQKYEENSYKADQRDGYSKMYYPNGMLQNEGWYKDDKKQGPWKYYSVSGKIDDEMYYVNDELNGYTKSYNINGELQYKEIYEDGMLTGVTQYDTLGRPFATKYFPLTNCIYEKRTFDNRPYFSCEMNYGMLHGKLLKQYPNGNLREVGKYMYGKRDSVFTTYFSNGQISSVGSYKNNKEQGQWKYYNDAGKLRSEENFRNGEQEGLSKSFVGGQLRYLDSFHNDNKEGKQYVYGEEGKLAGVLIYERGELIGYTYEGPDGKLLPEIKIENGTAKVNTMYANGKKAIEFNFKEDLYDGLQRLYYSNGQLAEERNFKDQRLEGVYNRFYPNGKPEYEGFYKNNELYGARKYFDEAGNVIVNSNYYYGYLHGTSVVTDPKTKKVVTETYRYGMLQ